MSIRRGENPSGMRNKVNWQEYHSVFMSVVYNIEFQMILLYFYTGDHIYGQLFFCQVKLVTLLIKQISEYKQK